MSVFKNHQNTTGAALPIKKDAAALGAPSKSTSTHETANSATPIT